MVLRWLVDTVLASPLFAVVLALVLAVLAMATANKIIVFAVGLAWLISFLGIAR